jgi:hypothetical protein
LNFDPLRDEPKSNVVTIIYTGASMLVDYPVRFAIDTAAWQGEGTLNGDCTDFDVVLSPSGEALAYWLEDHACGVSDAGIWVKVPYLDAAEPVVIVVRHGSVDPARSSDGNSVFDFFEDFEIAASWSRPNAEPPPTSWPIGQWIAYGDGAIQQVGDGFLSLWPAEAELAHSAVIESSGFQMSSDSQALGMSIRRLGPPTEHDDFEMGIGTFAGVTPGDPRGSFWFGDRRGRYATVVSTVFRTSAYGVTQACHSTPWTDTGFLGELTEHLAELWYEEEGGLTSLHFSEVNRSNGGTQYDYQSSDTCSPWADALPVLVVLDHCNCGPNHGIEIDWIFVRPRADIEPTVIVE